MLRPYKTKAPASRPSRDKFRPPLRLQREEVEDRTVRRGLEKFSNSEKPRGHQADFQRKLWIGRG
jgi:hypothetical protein